MVPEDNSSTTSLILSFYLMPIDLLCLILNLINFLYYATNQNKCRNLISNVS